MPDVPQPGADTGMRDFITFDEIAVRLSKIQKAIESQIPEGIAESATFSVSSYFVFDLSQAPAYGCRGPWMAVNISNDGTVDLQYSVNLGTTKDTIKPGETRERDMKSRGRIYSIEFYPTASTPVRLTFTR